MKRLNRRAAANVDVAFVGIAQRVSVHFLGADTSHPYTSMTFRPTEILKGSTLSSYGDIEVWTYGGSYVDLPAGRQLLNPAGIARGFYQERCISYRRRISTCLNWTASVSWPPMTRWCRLTARKCELATFSRRG
jgi:hypothetical protein